MSRIERPTTDADMQDLVERYGPTTVTIGLNQVRADRLNKFIDEFISDDAWHIELPIDGRDELYTQKFTTAVTLGGMMVHARLHNRPHTIDRSKQYVLVTDSLFDTEPEKYWVAGSNTLQIGRTTSNQTEITASQFVMYGYGPRSVDEAEEEPCDLTDRYLERALARVSLPKMSYGDAGWRLRVGPEAYDDMHDIRQIQHNIAQMREELAVSTASKVAVAQKHEYAPTGSDQ